MATSDSQFGAPIAPWPGKQPPFAAHDDLEEHTMPDNKSLSGGQDRKRINVNEDYEVRDWAKKFGVSPEKLKEAVAAVGGWADGVERYLTRS